MAKSSKFGGGYMPDGKFTRSLNRYLREWRRYGKCMCRAMEDATGDKHAAIGFDPSVLIVNKATGGAPNERTLLHALAIIGGWKAKRRSRAGGSR